jgi:hypothetical protein
MHSHDDHRQRACDGNSPELDVRAPLTLLNIAFVIPFIGRNL